MIVFQMRQLYVLSTLYIDWNGHSLHGILMSLCGPETAFLNFPNTKNGLFDAEETELDFNVRNRSSF